MGRHRPVGSDQYVVVVDDSKDSRYTTGWESADAPKKTAKKSAAKKSTTK